MPYNILIKTLPEGDKAVLFAEGTVGDFVKKVAKHFGEDPQGEGEAFNLVWIGRRLAVGGSSYLGPINEMTTMDDINPGVRDGYPPIHFVLKDQGKNIKG